MGKVIALLIAGAFCVLASYSCGRYCQQSYPKPTYHLVWASNKAKTIADIWGLTPEEVGQPVALWKEAK